MANPMSRYVHYPTNRISAKESTMDGAARTSLEEKEYCYSHWKTEKKETILFNVDVIVLLVGMANVICIGLIWKIMLLWKHVDYDEKIT